MRFDWKITNAVPGDFINTLNGKSVAERTIRRDNNKYNYAHEREK